MSPELTTMRSGRRWRTTTRDVGQLAEPQVAVAGGDGVVAVADDADDGDPGLRVHLGDAHQLDGPLVGADDERRLVEAALAPVDRQPRAPRGENRRQEGRP